MMLKLLELSNVNGKHSYSSGNGGVHIAICFFGQVKHYDMVAESVQRHIFDVLDSKNITYDIFAHTFNQSVFDNPRNEEHKVPIDPSSLQKILSLPQSAVIYDHLEDADASADLEYMAKNGDPWPQHPLLALRYFLRQMYSLKRVTHLWLPARHKYHFVLYLRPDALFLTDLDLPRIGPRLDNATLVTPSFACWANLWNDRLSYGRPDVMAAYGLRGDSLAGYVAAGKPPHAETFLGDHMASLRVANALSDTVFQRMRADGRIDRRDFLLANAKPRPGRC